MDASYRAQRPLLHRISGLIFRPGIGKAFLVIVAFLPAMALLADIQRFAVNVPFMDDWQFVPLLERAMNGTLTFQELWAPHDEHRLLLPRMIIIASMTPSWDRQNSSPSAPSRPYDPQVVFV